VGLIAVASIKGAPGVTTAALALGAVWPEERPVVVVEVDPAGGDVAARRGLPAEPSAVTLAAAARRDAGDTLLLEHAHELPGGLRVVAGSSAPSEMRSAAAVIAEALPALAAKADVDVLADCGRLDGATLGLAAGERPLAGALSPLLRRATMVLIVSRGELADLSHVHACVPSLRALNGNLALLLVGTAPWRDEEIAVELALDVIGHLYDDTTGALVVAGRARSAVARLPLLRSARSVADRIAGRLPPVVHVPETAIPAAELQGMAVTSEAAT